MYRPLVTIILLFLLAILSACRGEEPKRMPDTLPDIKGKVISINNAAAGDDKTVQLFVKATETQPEGYTEASISVNKKTLIEDKDGKLLNLSQLQERQQVEVWFEDEVMESMPVQATAKAVRVQLQ